MGTGTSSGESNSNGWEVEENLCGDFVTTFTIRSGQNTIMTVCSYGATLLSVRNRTSTGIKFEEITLNRTSLEELCNVKLNAKYGATCGRVAGRISNAYFTIKGEPGRWFSGDKTYYLEANNGSNCLHGGSNGYWRRNWDSQIVEGVNLSDFVTLQAQQEDI